MDVAPIIPLHQTSPEESLSIRGGCIESSVDTAEMSALVMNMSISRDVAFNSRKEKADAHRKLRLDYQAHQHVQRTAPMMCETTTLDAQTRDAPWNRGDFSSRQSTRNDRSSSLRYQRERGIGSHGVSIAPVDKFSRVPYKGAGILFFSDEGFFLVDERAWMDTRPKLGDPGGKIEDCDVNIPLCTALREMFEETTLNVDPDSIDVMAVLHLDFECKFQPPGYNYLLFVARAPPDVYARGRYKLISYESLQEFVPRFGEKPKNTSFTRRFFRFFVNMNLIPELKEKFVW